MQQMARDPNGFFGIMTLQRKYHRALTEYCRAHGLDFAEGLRILASKVSRHDQLTSGEWAALRGVIRLPIPYFLCPLDKYAHDYLQAASDQLEAPAGPNRRGRTALPCPQSAPHGDKTCPSVPQYTLPKTPSTQLILNAFGLRGTTIYSDLLRNITLAVSNGNIVLVAGTSGSGKSVLLNALDPSLKADKNVRINQPRLNSVQRWPPATAPTRRPAV